MQKLEIMQIKTYNLFVFVNVNDCLFLVHIVIVID